MQFSTRKLWGPIGKSREHRSECCFVEEKEDSGRGGYEQKSFGGEREFMVVVLLIAGLWWVRRESPPCWGSEVK